MDSQVQLTNFNFQKAQRLILRNEIMKILTKKWISERLALFDFLDYDPKLTIVNFD